MTPDKTHSVEIPALLPKIISVYVLSPIIIHYYLFNWYLLIKWSIINVLGFPIIYAFILVPIYIDEIIAPAPGTLY